MSLRDRWHLELERLKEQGRYRTLTPPTGIDFSSNDYLGYSKRAWRTADLPHSGTASRLLRGQHPIWNEVESRLAAWHHAEAALMMTSGYAANEGLLSTVIEPDDTVFSDQYNHASIIDGLRLSRANKMIYPHNDLNQLEAMMQSAAPKRKEDANWFVVTESLFGMEADRAPLRELVELTERYDANLIVDEAHATGCFGPAGSGLVDQFGLRQRVLATVHTGGKALAVPGAYIVGSRLLKDLLINRCRHFIYTTAIPPLVGAWWLDMLDWVPADEDARTRLHEAAREFRTQARRDGSGIDVGGGDFIATWHASNDGMAVEIASRLQGLGFDVRAIRPPTVPPGGARVRISIHADHEPAALRRLADALIQIVRPSP
jgi:8-amino-7-oxononanoate synthase